MSPAKTPAGPAASTEVPYDAGDLGCGDLVMALRGRLAEMRPGDVLVVTATDPGAVLDIPAWCGLTGHALVDERHPVYRIRRKED